MTPAPSDSCRRCRLSWLSPSGRSPVSSVAEVRMSLSRRRWPCRRSIPHRRLAPYRSDVLRNDNSLSLTRLCLVSVWMSPLFRSGTIRSPLHNSCLHCPPPSSPSVSVQVLPHSKPACWLKRPEPSLRARRS